MAEIPPAAQEREAGSEAPLPQSLLMFRSTQGVRLSPLQRPGLQREKPTAVCPSACARPQMAGERAQPGGRSLAYSHRHRVHGMAESWE